MTKSRLEAFSDGVIAIIITIMVLELKPPEGGGLAALQPVFPTLCAYGLSFLFMGIYWSNHHHLFQAVRSVRGAVLWANLNLLFWLSLTPFATAWLGGQHFAPVPVSIYGVALLMPAISYYILTRVLVSNHGADSTLSKAIGSELKERLSVALYAAGIVLAFVSTWIAMGLYVLVAILWLAPDRRIERAFDSIGPEPEG